MKHKGIKGVFIAGIIVIAVFAGVRIVQTNGSDSASANGASLPSAEKVPGWQMWDISDYKNANPWTETTKLKTLPIFENNLLDIYDTNDRRTNQDLAEMEAVLLEVAQRLEMNLETLEIGEGQWTAEEIQSIRADAASRGASLDEEYFRSTAIHAVQDGVKILVQADQSIRVEFQPQVPLPKEYQWGYGASYEDTVATTQYLAKRFEKLIAMEQPVINVNGGYYAKLAENLQEKFGRTYVPNYSMFVYEGAGDMATQILNYRFNHVGFYWDHNFEKDEVTLQSIALSPMLNRLTKVGDYPVISVAKAKRMLKKGDYITTIPEEELGVKFPGMPYVAKVELTYHALRNSTHFIPYYQFYVEMPMLEQADGMKKYSIYSVPAIEKTSLGDIELWDGKS